VEFDQFSGLRILACELSQHLVDGDHLFHRFRVRQATVNELDSPAIHHRASGVFLLRAFSIRMQRMASAAAAKKWPRLAQCWTVSTSTSRKYASCTKAVAWRDWPGAS